MFSITIDLAYEDTAQLLETLHEFTQLGISYDVVTVAGPGANWPEIELRGSKEVIKQELIRLNFEIDAYPEFDEAR